MVLKKETLLKLLLLLLVLNGLAVNGCKEFYLRNPFSTEPPIVLYPIEKSDIINMPIGSAIYTEPNKPAIMIEKDGWYISDFYMAEIMKAKVE